MAIFRSSYLNQVQIAAKASSRNRTKAIIQRFPSGMHCFLDHKPSVAVPSLSNGILSAVLSAFRVLVGSFTTMLLRFGWVDGNWRSTAWCRR